MTSGIFLFNFWNDFRDFIIIFKRFYDIYDCID